mgnify:FL=1
MKTIRRDTIRKLYREGMIQIFGCGDKDLDKDLIRAMKKDMHIAGQAPGGWVSEEAVLEIYCESYADEFGSNPADMVSYNSDKWCQLDEYVNLYLKSVGRSERVHHEPFNGAVIGIYWS